MSSSSSSLLHASCIAWQGWAALLCGPSGSGKSDLALRFLALGSEARLIADDQVQLERERGKLFASAPESLKNLLEIRGLGLMRIEALARAELRLIVNLVARDAVPRLPEAQFAALIEVKLPVLGLHAFDASTPVKLRVALEAIARMTPEAIQRDGFPDSDGKFG